MRSSLWVGGGSKPDLQNKREPEGKLHPDLPVEATEPRIENDVESGWNRKHLLLNDCNMVTLQTRF